MDRFLETCRLFPDAITYQNDTFCHSPVTRYDLDRDDTGPYRIYSVPSGACYPSITSILSETKSDRSKAGLQKWQEDIGEDEANRIRTAAARHGDTLHDNLEAYVKGDPVCCADFRERELLSKLVPHLDQNLTAVYGCELSLWSDRMRMAGTSDLPGQWRGRNAIIDFKNSRKPKRLNWIGDYVLQGVAYARMMEERYPELGVFGLIVIMIAVHGNKEQVFEIERTPKHDRKLLQRVVEFHKRMKS